MTGTSKDTSFRGAIDAYNLYKDLSNILGEELNEISIFQNQIILKCKNFLDMKVLTSLVEVMGMNPTDVSIFENELCVSYRLIDEYSTTDTVHQLMLLMGDISDCICTCPVLEMAVTDQYIKVYLDKPNIKIKDIAKLDDVMNVELPAGLFQFEGVLQIHEHRPYVLYVYS